MELICNISHERHKIYILTLPLVKGIVSRKFYMLLLVLLDG
jgi:hypothetical protein